MEVSFNERGELKEEHTTRGKIFETSKTVLSSYVAIRVWYLRPEIGIRLPGAKMYIRKKGKAKD